LVPPRSIPPRAAFDWVWATGGTYRASIDDPLGGLDDDLALHRQFVADRSPVYARTLDLLRPLVAGELADPLREAWRERSFGPWFERPLLLLTAIRDDALREGPRHPLWEALGDGGADADAVTEDRVRAATAPDRGHLWRSLGTRFVQTNETSRAFVWLWPAALWHDVAPGREIDLYDFGASAGLNLLADRMPWIWERAGGGELGPLELPPIRSRRGFDLRPLDLGDPGDERWLRALLWPGQTERMERFEAGLAAYRELAVGGDRPLVEAASVDDAAAALGPARTYGPRAIAYQSVMHDYLPAEVRARYEGGLREWLRASDPWAALWLELELAEGGTEAETAFALTAHLRVGDEPESIVLARSGPHPRVVSVDDAGVGRFRDLIRDR
jgi:hypothetical protein